MQTGSRCLVSEILAANGILATVLLLDVQERLTGRQNCVPNTTILSAAKYETVVTVSCANKKQGAHIALVAGDRDHLPCRDHN